MPTMRFADLGDFRFTTVFHERRPETKIHTVTFFVAKSGADPYLSLEVHDFGNGPERMHYYMHSTVDAAMSEYGAGLKLWTGGGGYRIQSVECVVFGKPLGRAAVCELFAELLARTTNANSILSEAELAELGVKLPLPPPRKNIIQSYSEEVDGNLLTGFGN